MAAELSSRGDARRPSIRMGPIGQRSAISASTSHPIETDPYAKELATRVEAKTTTEAKVRLLLAELVTSKTPAKARAVRLLNPIFDHFQIPTQMVSQVWAEAKACLSSPVPEVQHETLRLMGQCIQLQRGDLHAWQRKDYYDTIQRYPATSFDEVAYLGAALNVLIDNGRNIEGISSTLLTLLFRWIYFCSANSTGDGLESPHTSTRGFDTTDGGKVYEATMWTVERIFQYSYDELEEQDITCFFDFLCNQLAARTVSDEVLDNILTIIEIIPRHGNVIPAAASSHIIGFICMYYNRKTSRSNEFRKRFWKIIKMFLSLDHVAYQSLNILERLPSNNLGYGHRDLSKLRISGALAILGKCLEAQQQTNDFIATLSLAHALHCIKHAVSNPHAEVKMRALFLLSDILASDAIRSTLKYEEWEIIWESLEILVSFFSDPVRNFDPRHESDSTGPKDKHNEKMQNQLADIAEHLREICVKKDYTGSLARCVTFQSSLSKLISFDNHDFVLTNYDAAGLCMPTNSNWLGECEVILKDYVCNNSRNFLVRVRAIKILAKPIQFVTQDTDPLNEDFHKRIIVPLFRLLRTELDEYVCRALITIAVNLSSSEREYWAIECTKAIYVCATKDLPDRRPPQVPNRDSNCTLPTFESHESIKSQELPQSVQLEAVKGLIAMLERSLMRNSPALTQRVFKDLLQLAQKSTKDTGVRFEAAEALLRLRADSMYSVYLTHPLPHPYTKITVTGSSSLLLALNIDNPSPSPYQPTESPYSLPTDHLRPTDTEESEFESECPMTNGIDLLTEHLPDTPLKTFDDHASDDEVDGNDSDFEGGHNPYFTRERHVLPVSTWLETVINIIRDGGNWDLYNHILGHFPYQLSNKAFFAGCTSSIIRLREVLCQQLINLQLPQFDKLSSNPNQVKPIKQVKQGKHVKEFSQLSHTERMGIIGRLHSILTILIGYNDNFVKASRDELVRTFQNDMGRHNAPITTMCIHSLMVCCHELPKSIARCLSGILQTLSQQITNSELSVHILEFLVGVGRIPVIHDSFTSEEFLLVFQVALKFLGHFRQKKGVLEMSGRLAQYIVHLAYEALTVWFLAVRLENRRSHVSWIVRKLVLANDSQELDEHALVFVDMLERFSFSDSPLKKYPDTDEVGGLAHYKKNWVVGRSVHTAQVVREDGLVKIIVRKPVWQSSSDANLRRVCWSRITRRRWILTLMRSELGARS